ncbi:MAG: cyclic nucleotide-binding domain-containing protein [Anaerolineaceae bacterium]|nr:cyclic nucleotide-binding domain-containing protein [Anaerolineaceae bacterium]
MLETLNGITLFHDLSSAQLDFLDPLFEHISYPAETQIFEQGEKTNYLYVLLKGTILIKYKPYDGPEINVTRLRRGDVFGWSAVIGSKYYTSSTLSASSVELIRIASRDLWKLIRQHPETGKIFLDRLANVVSSRWKNAHAQVQALFDEGMSKIEDGRR